MYEAEEWTEEQQMDQQKLIAMFDAMKTTFKETEVIRAKVDTERQIQRHGRNEILFNRISGNQTRYSPRPSAFELAMFMKTVPEKWVSIDSLKLHTGRKDLQRMLYWTRKMFLTERRMKGKQVRKIKL